MFKKYLVFLVAFVFLFSGVVYAESLVIFHAGSLSIPLKKASTIFGEQNPGVKVLLEASGSRTAARKVSQLGRKADIVASADYTVIDNLLIPKFAKWNVVFARNEVVVAYTNKSKYANEINPKNWYKIVTRKGVSIGHSDPNVDPCGYRALMLFQLAEKYYKCQGVYKALKGKAMVRPKSVELIALLQTGNLDYAIEYRSVAVQHHLKFVQLPSEINLSSMRFASYYAKAKVKVTGKKPGTFILKKGKPIVYGLTMTTVAPHKQLAIKFLRFFLSVDGGLMILKECGQPPIVPPIAVTGKPFIPRELKGLLR